MNFFKDEDRCRNSKRGKLEKLGRGLKFWRNYAKIKHSAKFHKLASNFFLNRNFEINHRNSIKFSDANIITTLGAVHKLRKHGLGPFCTPQGFCLCLAYGLSKILDLAKSAYVIYGQSLRKGIWKFVLLLKQPLLAINRTCRHFHLA